MGEKCEGSASASKSGARGAGTAAAILIVPLNSELKCTSLCLLSYVALLRHLQYCLSASCWP